MKAERKVLHTEGIRDRRIIVYRDKSRNEKRIVVQWKEWGTGKRKYAVYPATPAGRIEAVSFAGGVAERLGRPAEVAPITTRELWDAYRDLELPKKKIRTQAIYGYRWHKWELFANKDSNANRATLEQAEKFRVEYSRLHAPNQAKAVLRVVKLVYNWGQRMEKLSTNKLAGFRFQFADGEEAAEPPEYAPDEFQRLVASFGRPQRLTWRAWALIVIAGTQGPRIRALMHLRWDDVDLAHRRVLWTKRFDKKAKDRWQPMVDDMVTALQVAKTWRGIEGYEGPWVFFSTHGNQGERKDQTYSGGVYRYQAAVRQLHLAERRGNVEPVQGRGFHGLRKCASGNALEVFGNPKDALDWIGDTDPRRLKEYAKKRDAHQQLVAAGLSGSAGKLPDSYHAERSKTDDPAQEVEGVAVLDVGER